MLTLISTGSILLANCGGGGSDSVAPPGPTVVTAAASAIGIDNVTLNGTVNPNALATTYWFEWGTDQFLATYDNTSATPAAPGVANVSVSNTLTGLTVGTPYYYRLAASNSAGTNKGLIEPFTTATPMDPPTVQTNAVDNVSVSGATLKGSVIPNGLATTAYFEWGTDNTLAVRNVTDPQQVGSDLTSHVVSAFLSSLSTGETYYHRIVATNSAGTSKGTTASFTYALAPTAVTSAAAPVGTDNAQLNGTVNPNGLATDYHFEWGLDNTSLFNSTPTVSAGSGTGDNTVNAVISSLSPVTNYSFRLVATNSEGTTQGLIRNFTTGAAATAPTVSTLPASSPGAIVATLNGSVTPGGLATTAWFEYGTDPTLAASFSTGGQSLGNGTVEVPVNVALSGLSAATPYYFRVAATNSAGTTRGSILSFTTSWPTFYSDVGFSGTDTGVFSVDFCPTVKHPPGGQFVLRLQDDFNTYFEVSNYDWDNPADPHPQASARKVRNRVTVDNVAFPGSYSQGTCYTIKITFSPTLTTVEAFGETIHLTANDAGFPVWSFMVETTDQDATITNVTTP